MEMGICVVTFILSAYVSYTIANQFSTVGDASYSMSHTNCLYAYYRAFPFFGQTRYMLYVCTNGMITFERGVTSTQPVMFPSLDDPSIAPFWADIDIRITGTIYYGLATGSRLTQLTDAVNIITFTPTWGYVVTWVDVPTPPGLIHQDRNTFQAALLTDGNSSFVIFNYEHLNWVGGAQMGFDAGDRLNGYNHEYSQSPSMTRLVNESNVGVAGRFIYSVAETQIKEVEQNVQTCIDLVALIDSSNDTTSDEFAEMKSLLSQLSSYDIGTGASEYQVAIVSFGKFIAKHWKWNSAQTSSPEALTSAIESIYRFGDGTSARVREAIKQTPPRIINQPGNRLGCSDICVVFVTDYVRLTKGFKAEIKNLQQSCDRVYSINVRNAPDNVMSKIASDEGYLFDMSAFSWRKVLF